MRLVHVNNDNYDVYIGRPSKWGNPYTHINNGKTLAKYITSSREEAIELYREYIEHGEGKHLLNDLHELKGKTLGCWCYPEKCHGEVLIELVEKYCPDNDQEIIKSKLKDYINNKKKTSNQ